MFVIMREIFVTLNFLLITNFYAQKIDTVRLTSGTWISGVEGGISNNKTLAPGGTDMEQSVDYVFNFNSGLFVSNRIALGLNAKLTKSGETRTTYKLSREEFYLGPWARYYIPVQHNWYLYPELGVSFVNYYSETRNDNQVDNSMISAQGFGVNPGIGLVYFVSKSAAFSIRWNYQWSSVSGKYEEVSINSTVSQPIKNYQYGKSSLFFGFQLYIDDFFF